MILASAPETCFDFVIDLVFYGGAEFVGIKPGIVAVGVGVAYKVEANQPASLVKANPADNADIQILRAGGSAVYFVTPWRMTLNTDHALSYPAPTRY